MTPHLTPDERAVLDEASRALLAFPIFTPTYRWPSASHLDAAHVRVKPARSECDFHHDHSECA